MIHALVLLFPAVAQAIQNQIIFSLAVNSSETANTTSRIPPKICYRNETITVNKTEIIKTVMTECD
jgi:hypothetical protein